MATSTLPPGSHGLPILGETLQFLFDKQFASKRIARYGPIYRSHILGRPTVFMNGPQAARFVLASHMDHFSWREGWPESFRILLGDSLFVQDGAEHRRNRRLLMPAFHGKALAGYFETMNRIIETYLARWEQIGEFAWFSENKQLTFDIASQTLLGADSGDDVARLSRLFNDLTNGFFVLRRSHLPWTKFGRALRARDELLTYIRGIVDQRRQRPTDDALSLLLAARDEDGSSLSTDEIVAQSMLLLFAGHETTTSMLTSFCLEMARNPQVLQRARDEQHAFAAEGALSLEQIRRMQYLEQIFREIERVHPAVPGGFRGVVKPFEFNGYHVPAGWQALYGILSTHRMPTIYAQPEVFDPDRFAPERAEHKQQAFSLIGFGGGPRVCLGAAFAQLEMRLLAVRLLRGYQWDLLPNQQLEMVTVPTRRPKDNLRVFFRRWYPDIPRI